VLPDDDQASAMVQDLALSSLSLIVSQPIEVISLDDHLVQTICATADDLCFEFIPFIHEALAIGVPVAEWAQAGTVRQVCALLASYYGRKPAHERQAVETRLAEVRQRFAQRSSCQRWRQRRRLSWQRDARAMRRVLRSGALFKPMPEAAVPAAIDEADPAFVLARDVVFWVLEGMVRQPRSIMTLDDRFGEPPYVEADYEIGESFVDEVEGLLQVNVSAREWSNAHTTRAICKALARHYRAKPAQERAVVEANLNALKVDRYNAPPVLPPAKWWHFWQWEIPRWPI